MFFYPFVCMSTNCEIQIYSRHDKINQACLEIEKNTKYLEKKYNFYDKDSYLNRFINFRNKSRIKIDTQSAEILKQVKALSAKLNHLFDISIGTYKHCFYLKSKEQLSQNLALLLPKSGASSWDINGRYLEFAFCETKLDLGGVIKEFAVDEAIKILRKFGINSAIVNFGGDLYALGIKPNGDMFNIGIKNPKNKDQNLFAVQICDQALCTSANYERSYKIENEEFSHILSLQKKQSDILSATVISDSVLKSGMYSTSFMIDTNINIPENLKVALIDKDLQVHQNLQV